MNEIFLFSSIATLYRKQAWQVPDYNLVDSGKKKKRKKKGCIFPASLGQDVIGSKTLTSNSSAID